MSDEPTILEEDEAALVVNKEGGMVFVMPKMEDDEPVPPMFLFLAAVLMKCDDIEWVEEMIASVRDE